jgi:hypothetical protein
VNDAIRFAVESRLHKDRTRVLCGVCGLPIAFIVVYGQGWPPGNPVRDPDRKDLRLYFELAYARDHQGIWDRSRHAAEQMTDRQRLVELRLAASGSRPLGRQVGRVEHPTVAGPGAAAVPSGVPHPAPTEHPVAFARCAKPFGCGRVNRLDEARLGVRWPGGFAMVPADGTARCPCCRGRRRPPRQLAGWGQGRAALPEEPRSRRRNTR